MWKNVVEVDSARGIYNVCGKFWTVGTRYTLHQHIGSGSYGDVCKATDHEASITVALKRVADVYCCPLLAKRVLREVCIMRRLTHPYVLALTNVFTNPSIDVERGTDLYIATEFADGGDLYHMDQVLTPEDVKRLMWQLLTGLNYIHSCRVWHRDIKSENILLDFHMSVKICDFGLSRSAEETDNLELRPGKPGGKQKTLRRQYTKMVVTPSYRAPEVIMSRGQYSSTIDIWSLGCIFWELLMRSIDPTMTGPPGRPLFGVREEPVTPKHGQNYSVDEFSPLHSQLDVIFDVIGAPGWNDIESVPSESWRSYLKHLPGRAGNLTSQLMGLVDQEALDLLLRMLTFNPSRRCTAEEALSHIYFKELAKPNEFLRASFEEAAPGELVWNIKDPAVALEILERELESSVFERDGGRQKLEWILQQEIEQQQLQNHFRHSLQKSLHSFQITPGNNVTTPPQTQQQNSKKKSRPPAAATAASMVNHNHTRMTRSHSRSSAAAAAAAAGASQASFVELAAGNSKVALQSMATKDKVEQQQIERAPVRRSPRLAELPHRKRLCLRAG